MIEVNIKTGDKAIVEQLLQFIKQIGLESSAKTEAARTQISVVEADKVEMNEAKFWNIIALLD